MPLKIMHVVGARPNFVKAAAVVRALSRSHRVQQMIVHTGQHYDHGMSDVFFAELEMPAPDANLQVGSGTHAQQTAEVMRRFEPVLLEYKPDTVLVYGDVNSTLAAALVCAKLRVRVSHVESGLRSFDRAMPEEINRILTDHACDELFSPSEDANSNLEREGLAPERIHLVGNVMIDTLVRMLPKAACIERADLPRRFGLVTLHRPSNVDDADWLPRMLRFLLETSHKLPLLFPVHPRTRGHLEAAGFRQNGNGLRLLEPLSYLEFLAMQRKAMLIITDSGGIQEEAAFLGVPCFTVRENTERPVTIHHGTNTLVGRDLDRLLRGIEATLAGQGKRSDLPAVWDGHAADRIAAIVTGSSCNQQHHPSSSVAQLPMIA